MKGTFSIYVRNAEEFARIVQANVNTSTSSRRSVFIGKDVEKELWGNIHFGSYEGIIKHLFIEEEAYRDNSLEITNIRRNPIGGGYDVIAFILNGKICYAFCVVYSQNMFEVYKTLFTNYILNFVDGRLELKCIGNNDLFKMVMPVTLLNNQGAFEMTPDGNNHPLTDIDFYSQVLDDSKTSGYSCVKDSISNTELYDFFLKNPKEVYRIPASLKSPTELRFSCVHQVGKGINEHSNLISYILSKNETRSESNIERIILLDTKEVTEPASATASERMITASYPNGGIASNVPVSNANAGDNSFATELTLLEEIYNKVSINAGSMNPEQLQSFVNLGSKIAALGSKVNADDGVTDLF